MMVTAVELALGLREQREKAAAATSAAPVQASAGVSLLDAAPQSPQQVMPMQAQQQPQPQHPVLQVQQLLQPQQQQQQQQLALQMQPPQQLVYMVGGGAPPLPPPPPLQVR
jgi:hypothetical protein